MRPRAHGAPVAIDGAEEPQRGERWIEADESPLLSVDDLARIGVIRLDK